MGETSGEINWGKVGAQAEYAKKVREAGENPKDRGKTDEQLREEYLDKKYPNAPRGKG